MNIKKAVGFAVLGMVALLATPAGSGNAHAQEAQLSIRTYKVQVQYWFFDTDYYYWSTVLETENRNDAQFLYDILLYAKEHGFLNEVAANSYWRYIAVDVRFRTEYNQALLEMQAAPLFRSWQK